MTPSFKALDSAQPSLARQMKNMSYFGAGHARASHVEGTMLTLWREADKSQTHSRKMEVGVDPRADLQLCDAATRIARWVVPRDHARLFGCADVC